MDSVWYLQLCPRHLKCLILLTNLHYSRFYHAHFVERALSLSEIQGFVQSHTTRKIPDCQTLIVSDSLYQWMSSQWWIKTETKKAVRVTHMLLKSWASLETKAISLLPGTSPSHCGETVSPLPAVPSILKPCSLTSLEPGRHSFVTQYQFCPFSKQHRIIFNMKIFCNS